jgi:hypothetical protein
MTKNKPKIQENLKSKNLKSGFYHTGLISSLCESGVTAEMEDFCVFILARNTDGVNVVHYQHPRFHTFRTVNLLRIRITSLWKTETRIMLSTERIILYSVIMSVVDK